MTTIKFLLAFALVVSSLSIELHAQQPMNMRQTLDSKQHSIVTVAAYCSRFDVEMVTGKEAGLEINFSPFKI